MEGPLMSSLHWKRIVELAHELREAHRARGKVDVDVAVRLARAVLLFQDQLLGTQARSLRR
jgi:hypothetical protein